MKNKNKQELNVLKNMTKEVLAWIAAIWIIFPLISLMN
jgi:hypothetical protein